MDEERETERQRGLLLAQMELGFDMRFAPVYVEYQADRIAEGDDDTVSIHIPAERENGQKRVWDESMEREREKEAYKYARFSHLAHIRHTGAPDDP